MQPMMPRFVAFCLGATATGCMVVALFFLRYYRDTRDRLFVMFAAAFFIEGVGRAILAFSPSPKEGSPVVYLSRCAAYLLILVGIWEKNRQRA